MLGRGATGALSSSDHSDIAALCIRVVWSPPSEMPPALWGAAPIVFLFFWASSSATALFPQTFSDTGGGLFVRPASTPSDFDEALMAPSSGCVVSRALTALGQSLLSTLEKYATHSYKWIFPQVN